MFLERGGEVYRLSRLMGHTDVKGTEKYLKDFASREARHGQSPSSPVEGLDLNRTRRSRKSGEKRG
jgi:integrase/recombinase XerD